MRNNFAMKLTTFVEVQSASGYFAEVMRRSDLKIGALDVIDYSNSETKACAIRKVKPRRAP